MPINCIDDKVVRVDAEAKARGEAMYVSDYSFPDMLYARMIRSDIPRGTIDSISVPQLPEVVEFLDFVRASKRGILPGDHHGRRA